jgi:hypothetical protein
LHLLNCNCSSCTITSQDIRTADWSDAVSPFWQAVIQSALSAKGVSGLLRAGWTTIKVPTQPINVQNGHAASDSKRLFQLFLLPPYRSACHDDGVLLCCRVLW